MTIDISAAIMTWALDSLPYDRNDHELCAELASMDAHQLIIVYHNWLARQVRPIKRRVLTSSAYNVNPIATARRTDLDALIKKIENGDDLTPHLSKRVAIVYDPANKIKRRKDLDLMLIEWEVHHLHISQNIESDGFVTRDDPLLFVMFRHETAYVLDLMTHHDFNRDHILRIMTEEWPSEGLVHVVRGALGISVNHTETERDKLRKGGVNTMVEINGTVISPLGGISGAGTSIRATMSANEVLRTTTKLENDMNANRHKYEAMAAQIGQTWPQNPTFEFGFLPEGGLGVVEKTTRLLFQVA